MPKGSGAIRGMGEKFAANPVTGSSTSRFRWHSSRMDSTTYDVFLSYHWRDHAQVEALARQLREQHVRVFLDRWYLTPGRAWRLELEEFLGKAGAVAICLGPGEMGPWQQREVSVALDRQAKDSRFPVIPVLLPHSEPALGFLGQNTWVDLRHGLDDPIRLAVLATAIRGLPPGPDTAQNTQATLASICPYRGLLFFREEDAAFFFGREAAIHQLFSALARTNFVPVVGASGSGKSSVVRAGLLPALRREREHSWEVVTLVPGDRPLHALSAALIPLLEPIMTETDRLMELNKQVAALRAGELKLRDILDRVLAKQTGTDRILLFIDQWEELYTLTQDDLVRKRFIDELLEATLASKAIHVVLTIRGDFVGHAFGNRSLVNRWQGAQVSLGPMDRRELERAIVEPAKKVALAFAPGLVERILGDVGDEPGNLPLLEFVLKQLWEARQAGQMSHDAYDMMGELQGAIASRAEKVFCALSPVEQQAVHRVFIQLVRPGKNSEDTRRRASLAEIAQPSWPLVWRLADQDHRLLVTGKDDATGEDTVEVSHEALIRSWGRLQEWLKADREFLLWRERFRAARGDWQHQDKDDRLLLHEPLLSEAENWRAKCGDQLIDDDRHFIEASGEIRAREEQAEKGRRERELAQVRALAHIEAKASKRLKWLAAFLMLAVATSIATAYRSQQLRDVATRASKIALSRQLVTQALLNTSTKLDRALLLSLAAQRATETGETRDTLLSTLQQVMPDRISFLSGHREWVQNVGGSAKVRSVAFSPDGKTLASASDDGTIMQWDVSSRRPLGEPLNGHDGPVHSVVFSPDGKALASAGADKTVRLWDVASGKPIGESLQGHQDMVRTVAFSMDGRSLASASYDQTIVLWDVASRKPVGNPLRGHRGPVSSIAFSTDGKTLASASDDQTVILWDVASSKPVGNPLQGHRGPVSSVAFSPDTKTLASASDDQTIILWDVASSKPVSEPLQGHQGGVSSLAFSRDGKTLGSASSDGIIIVWDVGSRMIMGPSEEGGPRDKRLEGHQGPLTSVSLSTDGKTLAASASQVVILWNMADSQRIGEPLQGHKRRVNSVAFSADSKTLASASDDQTIILWDANNRKPLGEPLQGQGPVSSMAFSPDGKTLASMSADKILLWHMRPEPVAEPLKGHQNFGFSLAFGADGKTVASVSNGKIVMWDAATREPIGKPQPVKSQRLRDVRLWSSAFSADGRTLAVAGETSYIILLDTSGMEIGESLNSQQLAVMSLAFSADGKILASAGLDTTVTLWDVVSRKPIGQPLKGYQSIVTALAFSHDGKMLATGGADETVRLWDVAGRRPIGKPFKGHQGSVTSVTFARDGKTLAAAGDDGTVMLWNVDVAAWEELACLIANRNMTRKEWDEYIGVAMAYTRLCRDLPVPKQ